MCVYIYICLGRNPQTAQASESESESRRVVCMSESYVYYIYIYVYIYIYTYEYVRVCTRTYRCTTYVYTIVCVLFSCADCCFTIVPTRRGPARARAAQLARQAITIILIIILLIRITNDNNNNNNNNNNKNNNDNNNTNDNTNNHDNNNDGNNSNAYNNNQKIKKTNHKNTPHWTQSASQRALGARPQKIFARERANILSPPLKLKSPRNQPKGKPCAADSCDLNGVYVHTVLPLRISLSEI